MGEAIGGTVYNAREGARVLNSKEERKEALNLINKQGSNKDKVIANAANVYVNYIAKPTAKFVAIPFNAAYTGAKYAGRESNPFRGFGKGLEGTFYGVAGGIANVPPEEHQTGFDKDWLTGGLIEALSDNRPQVKEYFEKNPLVAGILGGTSDALLGYGFTGFGGIGGDVLKAKVSNYGKASYVNEVEGMSNAINKTRVGQWMSKAEYEQFVKTGEIPRANVLTKGKEGYMKQANPGDYYVEFDVDSSLLVTKNEELGWSLVKSKNDMYLKLAEKKGQTLPAPNGTNITHVTKK